MKIKFHEPAVVGTLEKRIAIEEMDVVTFSFNAAPPGGNGSIILSVTLRDPKTGYQVHYVYNDHEDDKGQTLDLWRKIREMQIDGEQWIMPLVRRLVANGKLPPGELSHEPEIQTSQPLK